MQTENQFPAFPEYVVPGDYRRIKCGPFIITARIVPDNDTRATDFDCYTPKQLEAWKRGEWQLYGMILSVSVADCFLDAEYTLDTHAASLWGIDCNFPGDTNWHLQEIANDLLVEALARAETIRASLLAKLA